MPLQKYTSEALYLEQKGICSLSSSMTYGCRLSDPAKEVCWNSKTPLQLILYLRWKGVCAASFFDIVAFPDRQSSMHTLNIVQIPLAGLPIRQCSLGKSSMPDAIPGRIRVLYALQITSLGYLGNCPRKDMTAYLVLLLHASYHSVNCGLKLHKGDEVIGLPSSNQGSLIAHICYVCARKARRQGCHALREVGDGLFQFQLLQVDLEDLLSASDVWAVQCNLSVKPVGRNSSAHLQSLRYERTALKSLGRCLC